MLIYFVLRITAVIVTVSIAHWRRIQSYRAPRGVTSGNIPSRTHVETVMERTLAEVLRTGNAAAKLLLANELAARALALLKKSKSVSGTWFQNVFPVSEVVY